MTGALVSTRLFRIDRSLALTRQGTRHPDGRPPAVLVIPRGGPLREPRLMVLGDGPVHGGAPGPLDFADVHVTAVHRTHAAEVADVLVDGLPGPPGRLAALLERYPGCHVAAGAGPCGHTVAVRDAGASGTGFRLFTLSCGEGVRGPWAAIAGSFLYGWAAAGLATGELCRSVLIIGGLGVPERGGTGELLVSGGVQVRAAGQEIAP